MRYKPAASVSKKPCVRGGTLTDDDLPRATRGARKHMFGYAARRMSRH
jgi:hypothetical protein